MIYVSSKLSLKLKKSEPDPGHHLHPIIASKKNALNTQII